jgi:propionyl-CoA carboxylase alpha chain
MGEQAVALARAVQYETSGTVEFMVDKHKHWYFLEMNTRLQVEHPITEAITGLDLVEEMINVAQGKPLSVTQEKINIKGHAIESRVYAEDPYRGFLPSIGHLLKYREPKVENIRIDTGVREGDEISMYYDPLISKTITWGTDRNHAIELMKKALDTYVIRGLGHNVAFCRDVLRQPKFVQGTYSTKFIPETYPKGFKPLPLSEDEKLNLVGFLSQMKEVTNKFSVNPSNTETYVIKLGAEFYGVTKNETGQVGVLRLDSDQKDGSVLSPSISWNNTEPLISGSVNNKELHVQFYEHTHSGYQISFQGHFFKVEFLTPNQYELYHHCASAAAEGASQKEFLAPMPGAVISVAVGEGTKVETGQELAILEAMKMRNVLRAERPGVIKKVHCKAGQSVQVDQLLFEID